LVALLVITKQGLSNQVWWLERCTREWELFVYWLPSWTW